MSTTARDGQDGRTGIPAQGQLLIVVGYDGTDPSKRALVRAGEMVDDQWTRVEVVFVAHNPAGAAFSASALVEVGKAFEDTEQTLTKAAGEVLDGRGIGWQFQRRDGEIAHELLAVGEEFLAAHGPDSRVRLVVGGSAHKVDRLIHSVPSRIVRQDRFEVVVVP